MKMGSARKRFRKMNDSFCIGSVNMFRYTSLKNYRIHFQLFYLCINVYSCVCVYVCVYVCIRFTSFIKFGIQVDQVDITDWMYSPSSNRKRIISSRNPEAFNTSTNKDFNEHGKAEKTKNRFSINTLI